MHQHRRRAGGGVGRKPALQADAVGLILSLAAVAGFAALVAMTQPEPEPASEPEPVIVYDKPAEPQVPLYRQTDERWGGLPYADADLATSGCGLTCAAMAWEYLSGDTCTPAMLLNLVGNDYVQAGQNYMPGFCEWMCAQDDSLDCTVLYESAERALEESASGRMVFGTMSGSLIDGGREYGGHVVLIAENLYGHITIHDPCEAYAVILTRDEFNAVAWDYFISIGRG